MISITSARVYLIGQRYIRILLVQQTLNTDENSNVSSSNLSKIIITIFFRFIKVQFTYLIEARLVDFVNKIK